MSTLAVVEQIMRQTKTPMAVRDIVEIAGDVLPTRSKTPDTVVARDLSMDIKKHGEESRFIRTAPGRYTMREFVSNGSIQMGDSGNTPQPKSVRTTQESTPVLSHALSSERHGVMPAQTMSSSSSQEDSGRVVALQDDISSL
jgi:hypothetical protein